ncbi:MAG: NUDIX domain-containing protein [Patescibacteria group bacterium]|nr:NUDIX domain-containing protein [Patescibacteria group bacterium]
MPKIIVVSGPVIVEDGKVLLNQHGEDNFWKFCGGRVEDYNADLVENARREAKEEMGIDIEVINENPFITHLQKETAEGKVDVILAHFLVKRIGEVKPDVEIREWNWFSVDNLPENTAPNVKPALKHFGF